METLWNIMDGAVWGAGCAAVTAIVGCMLLAFLDFLFGRRTDWKKAYKGLEEDFRELKRKADGIEKFQGQVYRIVDAVKADPLAVSLCDFGMASVQEGNVESALRFLLDAHREKHAALAAAQGELALLRGRLARHEEEWIVAWKAVAAAKEEACR